MFRRVATCGHSPRIGDPDFSPSVNPRRCPLPGRFIAHIICCQHFNVVDYFCKHCRYIKQKKGGGLSHACTTYSLGRGKYNANNPHGGFRIQEGRNRMDNQLMTASEVAEMLRCSPSLIYQAGMKARLGAVHVGRRGIRFRREAVLRYVDEHAERGCVLPGKASLVPAGSRRRLISRHGLW
jgi:excisionase family DNA binding protein